MHFLILAILCSVSVSVLFKLVKRYNVTTEQMVAFGYVVALSLTYFLLTPDFKGLGFTEYVLQSESNWIFLTLGVLLSLGFIIMSKAVEHGGIVRTDAAQRLALFLQIIAAVVIFGEAITEMKTYGVIVAFFALFGLLYKPAGSLGNAKIAALSLAGVWLIWGTTGILFKIIALQGDGGVSLFMSFACAMVIMFTYLLIKRTQWTAPSLLAGIVLGVLNFGNILFYIKAHQFYKESPTIVYATMDVGVICLGTIIGAFAFKERISKVNIAGIALGILAILLLRL
ncbi:EamA/RhaT family transporter [Lonepinella koalarum]|uniref:EamA family transporter n=1 Tax=Lonepinella koalarum TaxID=53417 RepID=UPI0011E41953|nr:EamA/RhaT family transporter [Lonepinella koalarum]TYG33587.1 EamA/RhaT family transporter [Lonepinella koalarum]